MEALSEVLYLFYSQMVTNFNPLQADTDRQPDVTELIKRVKFTLEQAMKSQRGSRGIAVLFL